MIGLAIPAAAVVAAWLLHLVAVRLTRTLGQAPDEHVREAAVRLGRRPLLAILVLLALRITVDALPIGDTFALWLGRGLQAATILATGWMLVRLTELFQVAVEDRYRTDVADNLAARKMHTKVRLLRRIVAALVLIIAVALALMSFPGVRQIGVSLFASAGIAGLVMGIAARSTFSNLIAGVQVALAEPFRLDDVVIVDGEWGRIEEIHLTYVVVRIWDDRRLVVPLARFIESSFQNWTRTTSQLLGTVYLHVDYRTDVGLVRAKLEEVVRDDDRWDGRAWALQVTDATDRTIELRALMSAADAGAAWELRCAVRERLLSFLQSEHPDWLPRLRAELDGSASGNSAVRRSGAEGQVSAGATGD
jgi:small-conductance mechanosensitive channel